MIPIYDMNGIIQSEQMKEGQHIILLLMIKLSDVDADKYTSNFNYWHHRSGETCSIYLPGYSQYFYERYTDAVEVKGVNGEKWAYSDKCFVDVCDQLQNSLTNWSYSGEPELLILQRNLNPNATGRNILDFSQYVYIDINYGIQHKYIDSFPRFMERILNVCKSEVDLTKVMKFEKLKRLSPKKILIYAVENTPGLSKPISKVLGDHLFYKTSRTNKFFHGIGKAKYRIL